MKTKKELQDHTLSAPASGPGPASESPRVFVVDDEPLVLRTLDAVLAKAGCKVSAFASAEEVLAAVRADAPVDLLLSDLYLPGTDGLELLQEFKALRPDVPVLMLTGAPDTGTAVKAMNLGAAHYLIKPVNTQELQLVVLRTLETARTRAENLRLRLQLSGKATEIPPLVWKSAPMRLVMEQINRLVDLDTTLLITGENGTGKELLAQHVHRQSQRVDGPFVPVNCGAIPRDLLESELFGHRKGAFTGAIAESRGLFEEARGGTLFLDEVGELPLDMQVKLLHALDSHEVRAVGDVRGRQVDLRVIAATNRDLEDAVAKAQFRQDLYYRLNVFRIWLPPLRERGDDIFLLARFFLRESALRFNRPVRDFTPAALEALTAHRWPGNIRELSNAVQRAVVLCGAGLVDAVHLKFEEGSQAELAAAVNEAAGPSDPVDLNLKAALERSRTEIEQRYIRLALAQTDGNRSQAARLLGISYRALLYKLKDLGSGKV